MTAVMRVVPLLLVLAVLATGLVGVWLGYWRKGVVAIGVAPIVAAALRLALPKRDTELFSLRGRAFDVVVFAVIGVVLVVLAELVPLYHPGG